MVWEKILVIPQTNNPLNFISLKFRNFEILIQFPNPTQLKNLWTTSAESLLPQCGIHKSNPVLVLDIFNYYNDFLHTDLTLIR